MADRADVDDRVAQETKSAALVVREPGARVATIIDRSVDIVGRDADGFFQNLNSKRAIPFGQFGDLVIEFRQLEFF